MTTYLYREYARKYRTVYTNGFTISDKFKKGLRLEKNLRDDEVCSCIYLLLQTMKIVSI